VVQSVKVYTPIVVLFFSCAISTPVKVRSPREVTGIIVSLHSSPLVLSGVNPPGRARVYTCLETRGFAVARPAVDPLWGLKTNAPMAEVVKACQDASARHQADISAKARASFYADVRDNAPS